MNEYGLIGHPLSHSFSKKYFDKKFELEGLTNCMFHLFDLDNINRIDDLIENDSLKGYAITIPYKKQIIPFLHQQNDIVNQIEACNCVKLVNKKLIGFNTDILGFEESFVKELKPYHQKALILGNGGATASVKFVLNKLGLDFTIVIRNKSEVSILYEDVNEAVIQAHQIIINTTPLGAYPKIETHPNVPYQFLTDKHYLFDLVYNPAETLFMQKGKQQNAVVKNGYEMLCIQAEANWKIWNE